jgi:glycosyltransferase involved in cell wall biosynthesis
VNVLHIDEQRTWRGGEQQASWLIRGLVSRGHRVWIAGRPGAPFLTAEHGGVGVERIAVPLRNELDFRSARQMAQIVRENEIDVIHAHTSHAHMIACMTRRFARRGRVVVSRRIDFAPRANLFNRWKYRLPDAFISVSKRVDEALAQFGVPHRKRHVVYSSIDISRVDVAPLSREALGVPPDVPLLVSAGALVGHKDHATLIDAVEILSKHGRDFRLLIAGEGPLRADLEQRIVEASLGNRVLLLGHRDDVPALIRASDAYVSSSWSEGLGTSVLEALACQKPVVATDAGGVCEMVREGRTGWLVSNRNPDRLATAIAECLDSPERAQRFAEAGRALVERIFRVEKMVEGTIAVYESLTTAPEAQ